MGLFPNTQRGVFVNSPQGGKKIGELINGVLHMNRDYKLHHYNKFPGWAIDKATLDINIDRIHAFMIHSTMRPSADGKTVDEILSYTPQNLKQALKEMRIIDFGHGSQYLIPDACWSVELSTQTPIQLTPVTPEAPVSVPRPQTEKKEHPITGHSLKMLTDEGNRFVVPPPRHFNAVAVIPLLEAGYVVGYPILGKDFYFSLENNVLTLRKQGTEFSTRYEFSEKEYEERLFSILA